MIQKFLIETLFAAQGHLVKANTFLFATHRLKAMAIHFNETHLADNKKNRNLMVMD